MQSYAELLKSLGQGENEPCQEFVGSHEPIARSSAEVFSAARQRGAQLTALGLKRGDRVALMLSEPADFLPLIHGCLLFGLVAVPLYPPPLFGKLDVFLATLRSVLATAKASVLVVSEGLVARLGDAGTARVVSLTHLPAPGTAPPGPVGGSDLAFLQFTSGSTSAPKGVRITHGALMANARAIMHDGLSATRDDRGVSWLPLFHDMGLIGFGLAPLLTRTPVTFIPTSRFIRNPAIWLQTIHERRATITFAPNFAYSLVTRRVQPDAFDLSCVRMWGCGAEPIQPDILDAFERRFASCGVHSGQVAPCYGLAEATLAVTFSSPERGRRVDVIDADAWERSGDALPSDSARSVRYVSCGRALGEIQLSIVAENGELLGERRVGEIVVRGSSVADGYEAQPAATALSFRDGALHTGDRGYLADGELFVTGRIKDTVIVNGRNYDPHTIEAVAEAVAGVRLAVAINVAGSDGDELALIVESAKRDAAFADSVRANVAASLGVHAARVVCVAAGVLPRTTSGKLRRTAAKALLEMDPSEAGNGPQHA